MKITRGVNFKCQCTTVFERVIGLERRLKEIVEPNLREEQYGFRGEQSTIVPIFSIQLTMEKRWKKK